MLRAALLSLLGLLATVAAARAQGALCDVAIASAERSLSVPDAFLSAIARVESGRPLPGGAVQPWPWTINVDGQGHFYDDKASAIAAVQGYEAAGARSIDVGCMQVNLQHHPDAFASLDQAFDPAANALWAGRFLQTLFAQFGSWPLAAGAYHSQTPGLGAPYMEKVLETWAIPEHAGQGAGQGAARGAGRRGTGGYAAPLLPPVYVPTETAAASPGPASGMIPMGGGARVIRDPALGAIRGEDRGLAGYRARPIALAAGLMRVPGT